MTLDSTAQHMPTVMPSSDTRVIDAFTSPVRYIPQKRQPKKSPGFSVGTPRGMLEEAASLLIQAASLIAQAREADPRYRSALLSQIADASSDNADLAAAVARGMRAQRGARGHA